MASYDLTPKIAPNLDRHLVFPLLEFLQERNLYPDVDILKAKIELLKHTNMVDYAMDIHKSLYHTEDVPQDMIDRRVEVVARLKSLEESAASLISFLQNPSMLQELHPDRQYNLHMLKERYQICIVLHNKAISDVVMKKRMSWDFSNHQNPCSVLSLSKDYLGKTVQVIPHITDSIQEWIECVAMIPVDGKEWPADVCVIELGGTIGDIESMPFIEALGQFSYRVGPGNFCLIHVSLVPVLSVVGEQKTRPTQHSVRGLRGLGLTPNILACRSSTVLDANVKEKLSQFCHVPQTSSHSIFILCSVAREPVLEEWTTRAELCDKLHETVRIAMVGKYTGLSDSYLSVLKVFSK